MGSFTQASLATVSQFASDMGVEAGAGPDGSYTFYFSHWGALAILPSDDGADAVVSLSRKPARADAAAAARLLEAAGRDEAGQDFIHCGLDADGAHVCAVLIDQRAFDLVTFNRLLERLVATLDAVG